MILTLLERLEQQGGGALPEAEAPPAGFEPAGFQLAGTPPIGSEGQPSIGVAASAPRWCITTTDSTGGVTVASSGRWAQDGSLLAERSDDGVLVVEHSVEPDGALPFEEARSQERIVWVGDLEVVAPREQEQARSASARGSSHSGVIAGRPTVGAAKRGAGVDLVWALCSAENRPRSASPCILGLRLTLLGRPTGEMTFINEQMDGEVWLAATRDGRMAARMRPYADLPEVELVPHVGSLRFEAAPDWHRGVDVMHPDGRRTSEDRFLPGTFHWTLPAGARSAGLTIRLVDDVAAAKAVVGPSLRGKDVDPDDLLSEALALPGRAALQAVGSAGASAAAKAASSDARDVLRAHLLGTIELVDTPRLDVSLWSARAALLAAPPESSPAAGRPDVVTLLLLRRLVTRIERDALRYGSVGAALAGLPRWRGSGAPSLDPAAGEDGKADQTRSTGSLVAVEHAALAHQAVEHAVALAQAAGDAVLAARARRLARRLRRWFQNKFWLEKPRRTADLAASFGGPSAGPSAGPSTGPAPALAAFQLRPQMVMAASMEGAPLSTAQRQVIVKAAEARLLVPSLGVSTLDRDDLAYRGYSLEDGAAWPFLAGMFVEASLRAFGHDRGRQLALHRWLDSLHLDVAPMAWGHSGGAPTTAAPYAGAPFRVLHRPMPLGPLHFPLNALEGARARALLANGLPCPARPGAMSPRKAGPRKAGLRTSGPQTPGGRVDP